jgi:hypothetical protein
MMQASEPRFRIPHEAPDVFEVGLWSLPHRGEVQQLRLRDCACVQLDDDSLGFERTRRASPLLGESLNQHAGEGSLVCVVVSMGVKQARDRPLPA